MSKHIFLVPDYYSRFRCKGPDCRNSCCGGWPISISMEEYFRLLSLDCSPEMRRHLDCAFRLADQLGEEHYAQICPNYLGDCPMHLGNGLCGLQCDCGEKALPAVCRLFPRAVYTFGERACTCSSACELTVELLMETEEPLRFLRQELPLDGPTCEKTVLCTAEREKVRCFCFETISHRSISLQRRIDRIAAFLRERTEENAGIQIAACSAERQYAVLSDDVLFTIQTALAEHYASHSESVGESCKYALSVLRNPEICHVKVAELERRFPSLWVWLEKILCNYMAQECFPYGNEEMEVGHEGLALCAVYAFCLFLLSGSQPRDKQGFADLVAAAFRLIGHTAFDHNALVLIKRKIPALLN